jgi:NAD(P)H-dependent flavin oxidoreductase YrpB (nitropropane dioxygenase family)
MTEFIFMLTHHDVTIPNALEVFEEIKDTGLRFVGCKDIGLPIEKLQELFRKMKNADMTTFIEVVSNDEEKHFIGVEKAIRVGADYLIGGMPRFTRKTLEYLKEKKANLKFFPYIGKVIGHPCVLEGSVDEIVNNGVEFGKMGIHGINLLLYRYTGNVNLLLDRVIDALKIPLIVAGSIDDFEKIGQMKRKNVWAFTIGGAILEKKFAPAKNIKEQVATVLNLLQ